MGEPARRGPAVGDDVPVDPAAVDRAYRRHRARRYARDERARRRRYAGMRFVAFVTVLLALSVFLGLTVWREIEALFGL